MGKNPRHYAGKIVKELYKHAQRDNCYTCKELLRAMGLNPEAEEPKMLVKKDVGSH